MRKVLLKGSFKQLICDGTIAYEPSTVRYDANDNNDDNDNDGTERVGTDLTFSHGNARISTNLGSQKLRIWGSASFLEI